MGRIRSIIEPDKRRTLSCSDWNCQESMARQPKEKEVEIGKVFRRNAELEECAALLSAEAQA